MNLTKHTLRFGDGAVPPFGTPMRAVSTGQGCPGRAVHSMSNYGGHGRGKGSNFGSFAKCAGECREGTGKTDRTINCGLDDGSGGDPGCGDPAYGGQDDE